MKSCFKQEKTDIVIAKNAVYTEIETAGVVCRLDAIVETPAMRDQYGDRHEQIFLAVVNQKMRVLLIISVIVTHCFATSDHIMYVSRPGCAGSLFF